MEPGNLNQCPSQSRSSSLQVMTYHTDLHQLLLVTVLIVSSAVRHDQRCRASWRLQPTGAMLNEEGSSAEVGYSSLGGGSESGGENPGE